MLEWYATDLREMGFQPGSVVSHHEFPHMRPDDPVINNWRGGYIVRPRVAGTPTQHMFHKAGIGGSRTAIAARLEAAATGRRLSGKVCAMAALLAAGFDESTGRFEWDAVDPAMWQALGLRRQDLRTPIISIEPPPQAPVVRTPEGLSASALVRYKPLPDGALGEVVEGPDPHGRWLCQFGAGRHWLAAAMLDVVMEAAPF